MIKENIRQNNLGETEDGIEGDENRVQQTDMRTVGSGIEEINTKEVAAQITAELKRYSIPQAIFAQRVLCRSQVHFVYKTKISKILAEIIYLSHII